MGCISSKNVSCLTDQGESPVPEPGLISTSQQHRVLIDHSLEASHNSKRSRKSRRLGGSDLRIGVSLGLSHRNIEAEQAAAGWPAWLCSAAAEAVHGWVPLKAEAFQKLEKVNILFLVKEVTQTKGYFLFCLCVDELFWMLDWTRNI